MFHTLIFALLITTPPASNDDGKTAAASNVAEKDVKLLKRLVAGVTAIRDSGWKLSAKRTLKIAKAALFASKKTGVDPFLLVGLARMESDFRPLVLINADCQGKRPRFRGQYCYADCGITQHHVRGSWYYVHNECRRLRRDFKRSFLKSAKEIASHKVWCKSHMRFDRRLRRCVLNRYNQGTFYKKVPLCTRRSRYPTAKARYSCRRKAIYWKKVLCFKYGAVNGLSPVRVYRYRSGRRRGRKYSWDHCRYFRWRWPVNEIPKRAYNVTPPPASTAMRDSGAR